MARTESTMHLQPGAEAPEFALEGPAGVAVRPCDFAGSPLLVAFLCNHCPYVKHLADALAAFVLEYAAHGLKTVGISSNDPAQYPEDGPESMRIEAKRRGYAFPYLFDASQEVARAYRAACTPDFFLFDRSHRLFYRGRFDGTRPARIASGVYDSSAEPPTGADLRAAADAVLAGRPAPPVQRPSLGCGIKWKPGNAPSYAV